MKRFALLLVLLGAALVASRPVYYVNRHARDDCTAFITPEWASGRMNAHVRGTVVPDRQVVDGW